MLVSRAVRDGPTTATKCLMNSLKCWSLRVAGRHATPPAWMWLDGVLQAFGGALSENRIPAMWQVNAAGYLWLFWSASHIGIAY